MIYVVDYGAGNIGSVLNMIRKVGGMQLLPHNLMNCGVPKRYCFRVSAALITR
jgi:hypothetical protein